MATAKIEWEDGTEWTIEEYEEYQKYLTIASDRRWHWTEYMDRIAELEQTVEYNRSHGERL